MLPKLHILAKVGNSWEDEEERWAERVVALASVVEQEQYEQFVLARRAMPLLFWYCIDSTESTLMIFMYNTHYIHLSYSCGLG